MEKYRGDVFSESALILPVPEIQSIAQPYRRNYTTDGAIGLLPHITLLYPFITHRRWNTSLYDTLKTCLSRFSPFNYELTQLVRFPAHKTLFLDPTPNEAILQMTKALVEAFPDYQPYGGTITIDELHPHVTIAICPKEDELDEIEKSFISKIGDQLPFAITANEVWFVVKSNDQWQRHTTFKIE